MIRLLGAPAAAIASPVELEFHGVAGCASDDFTRSLDAYLAASTAARAVRVRVRVGQARGGGWSAALTLVVGQTRSARRLVGATCLEVSEAAAFVTAVVVDPGVLERPRSDQPAASPTVEEPAAPAVVLVPEVGAVPAPVPAYEPAVVVIEEPVVAPAVRRGPGGFVRLTGGVEALGMPRVGAQLGLTTGLLGRAWRVELGGMYRAPSRAWAVEDPSAGARVGLWAVAGRGCGVVRPGRFELPLCVGVEAGQAIGAGFGFVGAERDRIPWLAALVAPALAWAPRRWLAVWVGAELALPMLGGRFKVSGLGPLFTVGRVSLRASVGLELRFF